MTEPSSALERRTGGSGGSRPHSYRLRRRSTAARADQIVLALSAIGYPLTQLAIRRLGRRGAVVVESVCAGLLVRDATLLALGTPRRLRRGPATFLWLEAVAAFAATLLCLAPLTGPDALGRAGATRATGPEAARRVAVRALFGLHHLRFRIYLQPDHGRRAADVRSTRNADR